MASMMPVQNVEDGRNVFTGKSFIRPHRLTLSPYQPIVPSEVAEPFVSLEYARVYPDTESRCLLAALAEDSGLRASYTLAGCGAHELNDLIVGRVLDPGGKIVDCPPTFTMYEFDAAVNGALVLDFSLNVSCTSEVAEKEEPKRISLISPNNPDGSEINVMDLLKIFDLPVLVMLDKANTEKLIVRRTCSKRAENWSDPCQPILELILRHLTLPEQIRFASVCQSWRKAQRKTLRPIASHAPFLIVRRKENSQLFSLSENKMTMTAVPHCFCTESTFSSSGGWLLLQERLDLGDGRKRSKFLFNPFTSAQVDLPEAEENIYYHDCLFFSSRDYPAGALLVTKTNKKFLLCGLNNPSNPTFRQVEWRETAFVSNIIFFQGQLHALNEDGSLVLADPPFDNSVVKGMNLPNSRLPQWHWLGGSYLVESCGQLLLVRVLKFRTGLSFEVFRADLTKSEWREIENLGDRALFLSQRGSVSVCASETSCKANHIYYAPSKVEWDFILYNQPNGMRTYVEFELGRDGLDIPSIPGCDGVIGCQWLT